MAPRFYSEGDEGLEQVDEGAGNPPFRHFREGGNPEIQSAKHYHRR